MKVAYIVPRFPTVTETFVVSEALAIEDQGIDVEVYPLMRGRPDVMQTDSIRLRSRVHYTPFVSIAIAIANLRFLLRKPVAYLSALLEALTGTIRRPDYFFAGLLIFPKTVYLAERVVKTGVGHVHAHFAHHPALAALVIHRLTGIPFSFTVHGHDLHIRPQMIERKVSAAAFVVTISEYNKRLLVERCGELSSRRIHVVHCGVDPQVFKPQLRNGNSGAKFLAIGALREVKGHRFLLEACGLLRQRGIEFHCDIVGEGPERVRLEAEIESLGLTDAVTLHGACARERILELMHCCDVFVQPSVWTHRGSREGIPVALMEAMAAGMTVVASNLSGIPELVHSFEDGLLIRPGDITGIAAALEIVCARPEMRGRMGQRARATVVREFSIAENSARMAALFRTGIPSPAREEELKPGELLASVIMPVRNEEAFIGRCLQTVLENDLPRCNYEVLVVDGRSTDRTREVIRREAARYPSIRLLDNPGRIVPTALNIGISEARGRYIIRLDAHAEYPKDYLRSCLEELARTGADNVGGRCISKPGGATLSAACVSLITQHRFGVGGSAYRTGHTGKYVDTVPFGAYRRELFEHIGLYDESLVRHQDYELNARIRKHGGKIFLSDRISCVYFGRASLRTLLSQAYRNGIWNARAWTWRPYTFCARRSAPVVLLLTLLACSVFSGIAPVRHTGIAVACAYAAAALIATIPVCARHGARFVVLPVFFTGFHFAFAAGVLRGLVTAPFVRPREAPPPLGQTLNSATTASDSRSAVA